MTEASTDRIAELEAEVARMRESIVGMAAELDALRKVVEEQAGRLCKIPCGNGLDAMDVMITVRALRAALGGEKP